MDKNSDRYLSKYSYQNLCCGDEFNWY